MSPACWSGPDAGEVSIDGARRRPCADDARTALRRDSIGFVYQFHHLLPEFSALENVMLPQMIARHLAQEASRSARRELLDYLGLGARGAHRPAELSGGEQQRVAIARAVANAPAVLLADEPTGNLDPRTADHVFETLIALVRGTGLAALVATHNLELAAAHPPHDLARRTADRAGVVVNRRRAICADMSSSLTPLQHRPCQKKTAARHGRREASNRTIQRAQPRRVLE